MVRRRSTLPSKSSTVRAHRYVNFLHPSVDHKSELSHLDERFRRDAFGADVCLDLVQFGADMRIVARQVIDASKYFGEIDRIDGDTGSFKNFLAESYRLERCGSCADRADACVLETANNATDADEVAQIGVEAFGLRSLSVDRSERVRDPVLSEHVARGHLAAERVTSGVDSHFRRIIGGRVDENRNIEAGHPQCFGYRAFIAKVWERDDHTGDFIGIGAEERGAGLGLVPTFDGSVDRIFRAERNCVDPLGSQRFEYVVAAGLGQMTGKEAPVADDHAERDPFWGCGTRGASLGGRGALGGELATGVGFQFMDLH